MLDPCRYDVGSPPGTIALALALAAEAAEHAERLTGRRHKIDELAVVAHVLLPLVVGDVSTSTTPRRAPAGGWVHADLLADDEGLYATLATADPSPDAEALAASAQDCRLPVTPYRVGAAAVGRTSPSTNGRTRTRLEPRDITVVDMTAMWAGPLCTAALAAWGARVVVVEADVRRDGMRRSPAQFTALDRGKERRAWDLRDASDRRAFERLIGEADLLVESFSDRVLPNLGYDGTALRALNPDLVVTAVRAFPPDSAEASWVAYGRGVHAASGLGMVGGVPVPAPLAYPDPLAGLLALATSLDALTTVGEHEPVVVSLAGAIEPLRAAGRAGLGGGNLAAAQAIPASALLRPVLVPIDPGRGAAATSSWSGPISDGLS